MLNQAFSVLHRRKTRFAAVILALGLNACADIDPAYDPIEWSRSVSRGVSGLFGDEPAPVRGNTEPPPAEGRPYPNLATVPTSPGLAPAANRKQEIDKLVASRDAAIDADQSVRSADVTPGTSEPDRRPMSSDVRVTAGGSPPAAAQVASPARTPPGATPTLSSSLFMGSVVVEEQGGPLAAFQRKVLEDAAAMAVKDQARIRLVGGASPATRDRVASDLVQLGVPASRITGTARPGPGPARPAVEIFVDY